MLDSTVSKSRKTIFGKTLRLTFILFQMRLLDQRWYTPCQLIYDPDCLDTAFHQRTIPIPTLELFADPKIEIQNTGMRKENTYFTLGCIVTLALRDDASLFVSWAQAAAAALAKSFAKPTADS